ncbi:DUF4116 domain-containing protein [Salmonella enterica subsp. salamae]|nr:DUF4116 domain-containing protein [Salmonella enterica subsp. salamae]ECJ2280742.1 DUF4116 domain-containing protein [Salmonella enterica subsp. salamae]
MAEIKLTDGRTLTLEEVISCPGGTHYVKISDGEFQEEIITTFEEICIKLEKEFSEAPALYKLSDSYLPLASLSDIDVCKTPPPPSNEHAALSVEDNAAQRITKFMRKNISHKSYNVMFSTGSAWHELSEKYSERGLELMRRLSKDNISNLRKALSPLNNDEKAFLDAILTIKLHATHASDAKLINKDNILKIYSRNLLIEKKIPFPPTHSDYDSCLLANEDFVFFSLEPGEEHKKSASRFGSSIYCFDINQPVFEQVSSINLYDQIAKLNPDPHKHIQGLSEEAAVILQRRESSVYNFMFFGKDLRTGLGLYLLKRIRAIPESDRQKILAMKEEHELNRVINGILRPEIKIPKYFFSKKYSSALFDGSGGFLDPQKINDKSYMLDKIKISYKAFIHCSDDLKNDFDLAILAVSQQGKALKHVSDELKKNRYIVWMAVITSGNALQFSDEKFKNNKQIVLAAVQQTGEALAFASEALKNDREFLLTAIQLSAIALMYVPDKFKDDKAFVKEVVNVSPLALEFCSDQFKDDQEIVLSAVQRCGKTLKYASERLKDNHSIILTAIKNDKIAAIYASDNIKKAFNLNNW